MIFGGKQIQSIPTALLWVRRIIGYLFRRPRIGQTMTLAGHRYVRTEVINRPAAAVQEMGIAPDARVTADGKVRVTADGKIRIVAQNRYLRAPSATVPEPATLALTLGSWVYAGSPESAHSAAAGASLSLVSQTYQPHTTIAAQDACTASLTLSAQTLSPAGKYASRQKAGQEMTLFLWKYEPANA
ncbi:MAG: hypothetical protein LBK99_01535 [Opitutaceae bacterium]|jgi:hypothetical protein|nr:hypothetical protein [Opitutaceae bacterium]